MKNKGFIIFLIFFFISISQEYNLYAQSTIKQDSSFYYRKNIFSDLNSKSWLNLLEAKEFHYRPPYTINLLIQPVHSPSWIYVNPSMAVSRRYVSNGLTNNVEKTLAAKCQEDMVMQFAFDDPAFMPNFNLTELSLKDNRYPIVSADYYANDIYYHVEYMVTSIDEIQNVLCVNVWVKNESASEKKAHVRVKLGYYPENEIFDYHYIPFYWDNTKWRFYDKIFMKESDIFKDSKRIGQVMPGTMEVEWEPVKTYTDKNYEDILYPQVWFGSGYVLPPYRLKNIQDVIYAHKSMKPNESVHFSLKLLVDDVNATEKQFNQLAILSPDKIKSKALSDFKKEISGEKETQLNFNKNNWSDIFSELQLSIKQLLIKYPGDTIYQTSQGGSSERFYVWVFEAVHMLRSMLRVGQFDDVRKGLDFIFSLQDAGCPPVGKFTTTEGSIGTTGPRWANTTGMALVLACEYYLYTHDKNFLDQYLPKILKAVHWIEGEVIATRQLGEDGSRPLTYGLMPYAVGCDADTGYCISDTDVFTYWGFYKTVELLESINHHEANELRKQLDQYHNDLLYTIEHLKEPNGYINRMIIVDGVKQDIQPKFEIGDSMTPIALVGIMNPTEQTFLNYMHFFESNYSDGQFVGGMDREIMYTNQCEHYWQQVYLKLGEWKKAFIVTQTCLKYGMSPNTYQTSERMSKRNPAFAPWQPNGSANGRIIDMMLNSFYYENDANTITLLGAIPFEWIKDAGPVTIKNLFTLTGKVDIIINPINKHSYSVRLIGENTLPENICIPEYFKATSNSYQVNKVSNTLFKAKKKIKDMCFVIHQDEN